jgi:hypothetical protein
VTVKSLFFRMKKLIQLLTAIVLLLSFVTGELLAQPGHTIMRGKEGDICYAAEVNFRQHRYLDHVTAIAHDDYMKCLARQYTSGQANLYEVGQRVHNNEVNELLSAIAWTYCDRSSPDNCLQNYMDLLHSLDSDQDGEPDLFDPTPLGENPPPDIPLGDEDGDGVTDDLDECGGTPAGWNVTDKGCPQLVLEAQTDQSFYEMGVEEIVVSVNVYAPDGETPMPNARVHFMWDNYKYIPTAEIFGTLEIPFEPLEVPFKYELEVIAIPPSKYREIKPNSTTVNFAVRPSLGISMETDKDKYLVGENIHITGKVSSPEPIGSDLDIYCEVKVYDSKDTEAAPYRLQRVPLSSNGNFSYSIPIYGPDKAGKWQESGELGEWWVIAEVHKGGKEAWDSKPISVYKHHVDMNKATREFWAQRHAQTTNNTQSFDRPSHGESILLGPNTEATFAQTETIENLIKLLDGEILYLKDMRQRLSDAQRELLQGNPDEYITLEGQHTTVTSINSSYVLKADPATGTDKVTVFHGPVAIASSSGKFATLDVERATEVIVNAEGIQSKRSLSKSDQWEAGQPFVAALGGTNPADLQHQSDPYADELDPNYQPGLEELLADYALYLIGGIVGLVLLILVFRRKGKSKTKVEAPVSPPKKKEPVATKMESSASDWEATRVCTNCESVMPMSAKFCPSCGAKQG